MVKSKVAASVKDQAKQKMPSKAAKAAQSIKKSAPAAGGLKDEKERIKRRNRPGTVALREVKAYQKSIDMLLPRAPFQRLVREITTDLNPTLRF